jgi:hypothetical protein
VLAPGGTIAVAFQPVVPGATPGLVRATGDWLMEQLAVAGCTNVRLEIGDTKPMGAACALAGKQDIQDRPRHLASVA